MDYDFLILDNPFLVHKPGIKTLKMKKVDNMTHSIHVKMQNRLIRDVIQPELFKSVGKREGCRVRN